MKILNEEVILDEAKKVKPDTIARIGYRSSLPVKAEYKKQGVHITKFTETSARLGVNYFNICTVINRKLLESGKEKRQYTNNYEWVIKNKVSHNTSTGKNYLYVATFNKGHNTKSIYRVEDNGTVLTMTKDELLDSKYKHYVIDSYWKGLSTNSEVRNISFENIFKINSAGESADVSHCLRIE